jgi:hypothetical protein
LSASMNSSADGSVLRRFIRARLRQAIISLR